MKLYPGYECYCGEKSRNLTVGVLQSKHPAEYISDNLEDIGETSPLPTLVIYEKNVKKDEKNMSSWARLNRSDASQLQLWLK